MEYISKDKTLKKLQMQLLDLEADQDKGEYSELCENRGARDALDEAINDIRAIKGEDVQPVKHAKWILFAKDNVGRAFYCSNCRKATTTDDFENSPLEREEYFCPRCGARMDGDTNG